MLGRWDQVDGQLSAKWWGPTSGGSHGCKRGSLESASGLGQSGGQESGQGTGSTGSAVAKRAGVEKGGKVEPSSRANTSRLASQYTDQGGVPEAPRNLHGFGITHISRAFSGDVTLGLRRLLCGL